MKPPWCPGEAQLLTGVQLKPPDILWSFSIKALMLASRGRHLWGDGPLAVLTNVQFIFHFTSHIDHHKMRLSWCSYHQLGLVTLFASWRWVVGTRPRASCAIFTGEQRRVWPPIIPPNLPHPFHERYRDTGVDLHNTAWRIRRIFHLWRV